MPGTAVKPSLEPGYHSERLRKRGLVQLGPRVSTDMLLKLRQLHNERFPEMTWNDFQVMAFARLLIDHDFLP